MKLKKGKTKKQYFLEKSILKLSLFLNELCKITYENKLRYVMEITSRVTTKWSYTEASEGYQPYL